LTLSAPALKPVGVNSAYRIELLKKRKVRAYRWLYEFTRAQCSDCARTDCACKDSICAHVEEQAGLRGVRLEHTGHRLRFIGCAGCVVPPHLRETCTIYLCAPAQAAPGFPRRQYQRLLQHCSRIEQSLMELT
jgi:hypothetical protein